MGSCDDDQTGDPHRKENGMMRPLPNTAAPLLFFLGTIVLLATTVSSSDRSYRRKSHPGNSQSSSHRSLSLLAFGIVPDPSSTPLVQALVGSVTYLALIGYYDRPRGHLRIDPSLVVKRTSRVPNAGLGLFAARRLREGTILGTYPGVLRPAANYLKKCRAFPRAGSYAWRFGDDSHYIDPTDRFGNLRDYCVGGTDDFPFSHLLHGRVLHHRRVSTLLARINEPPIGGTGCNVRSEEDLQKRQVTFLLSRDVDRGEELFMDYGLTYDRSMYAVGSADSSLNRFSTESSKDRR